MDELLELKVAGIRYAGWKSIEVHRSMEELSASFSLGLVDRWLPGQEPIPLGKGDACELVVGKETVLTGWLDDVHDAYEGDASELNVTGRSKAGDLVDCAAVRKGGQWSAAKLEDIALDIVRPFGMEVFVEPTDIDPKPLKFTLQVGELAASALTRLAQLKGLLCTTDGGANVVFTRAGSERTATIIERGVNVRRGERMESMRDQFQTYTVKAQSAATQSDRLFGLKPAAHSAQARDPDVTRYRPTVVLSDDREAVSAMRRAEWQRNVRAGRSMRYKYTLAGWLNAERHVWSPNTLVPIIDDRFGFQADMLIVDVSLLRDDQGQRVELEVCDPRGFEAEIPPAKALPRKRNPQKTPKRRSF